MVSTHIHTYCHYLYDICGIESVRQILGVSFFYNHPICVPIHAYEVAYSRVRHMYWDIYVYIYHFLVHVPDNFIPVVILLDII